MTERRTPTEPTAAPAWAWPALIVAGLLAFAGWRIAAIDDAVGPSVLSVAASPEPSTESSQHQSTLPERRRFAAGWSLPRMIDVQGEVRQPGADPRARALVFVFLATECPISNGYLPELNRLHARFGAAIEMYGVIADRFGTPKEAAEHQRSFGITFPVLRDTSGLLQRRTGATRTPEVAVVNADGELAYRGRIDDRYREIARPRPTADVHELEDALAAIVEGRTPPVARTEAVGCRLEPVDVTANDADVTFCRDVAPIVFANCTTCHREGEAVPFVLETPDDARRRATQIAEVVTGGIMPPWQPRAGFGHFLNERRLHEREIAIIARWAAAGAPLGDEADLPPVPTFPTDWQLGEPDLVLEMPEPIDIPADGPDLYQHFVLPTGLVGNRLVRAFEFRPGAASVVHHAWVYFDTHGEARRLDAADPRPGYERFGGPGFTPTGNLGGWGPGGLPRELPKGMGRVIPGGSDLVLQVHYHPTGRAERDRSRIGLYFAEPGADQLVTEIMIADVDLEIPAGANRHRFEASYTLPVETDLLDCSPHMHLLGREMQVTATTPAGDVVPLIRIDDWNFYWQDHYVFEQPVRLPAGTRIDMQAWYDNSAANPHNPHSPPRRAKFGEYSDDEMGICYFQVTTPDRDDLTVLARHSTDHFARMMDRYEEEKRDRDVGRISNPPVQDEGRPLPSPDEIDSKADAGTGGLETRPTTSADSKGPREDVEWLNFPPGLPGSTSNTINGRKAPEIRTATNSIGMHLALLPAGSFAMGLADPRPFAPYSRGEWPERVVELTRPFAIGRHEVTVGQFRRFIEATGYRTIAERTGEGCNGIDLKTGALVRQPKWIWSSPMFPQTDRHPVVCVDWADATAFCAWLSRKEGRTYRLPTEAEWEYACRGGSTTLFCSGNEAGDLEGYGNAGDWALKGVFASAGGTAPWDDGHAFTAPVGSFSANAFGLHDMHGNVGEWCHDWYDRRYYSRGENRDPTGPLRRPLGESWRVVRGGSWYNTPTSCRSTNRHDDIPTARSVTNGFRVVLEVE